MDPRPYDLQTSLRLELDEAHIQLFVEDHGCRWVYVIGAHNFRYALVQRALQDRLGRAIRNVRRCKAKLDRIVPQEFASFLRHLCKVSIRLKDINKRTHDVIVMLLAQYEIEFGVIMIGVLEFWTENNHYTVLQEVIELYGIRVETLTLQIMDPG